MFDTEPGTGQQVLHLEAEHVSHRKPVKEALLASTWVRHAVDQLDVVDLVEAVHSEDSVCTHHAPSVRHRELRLLASFFTNAEAGKGVERGVEEVHDQRAGVGKMRTDAGEARELVFDGEQVLERPERNRRQREPLFEVEPAHVGLHQPGAPADLFGLAVQPPPADAEHPR